MKIKPIRTEADYKAALGAIDTLLGAKAGTDAYDRLDVISTLVEKYEDEHHGIEPPDPVEAIKFRMEQMGLTRKQLEPYLGGRSRVSEILNRRRGLTINQARRLVRLGVPAHVLLAEPPKPTPRRSSVKRRTPRGRGATPTSIDDER